MKPRRLSFPLATAIAALLAVQSASALTYYWDTDGDTAGFGNTAGTWGTDPYWTIEAGGDATHTAVTSPTTSDAVHFGTATLALGATASAVAVSGTVNAQNITFGAAQTTPIVLSGGSINLGATSTITVTNTTNSISSDLTGAGTLLTKTGTGSLVLSGITSFGTGATTISGGVLAITGSATLGTGNLTLSGGVLGLGTGNFSLALGTAAGQFRWTSNGGFAAYGADRTVTTGTASTSINWNATNFIGAGNQLLLSAANSDATITFNKNISLAGGNRTINVANGSADIDAKMTQTISGGSSGTSNGLIKSGSGTLALMAATSYWGPTNITAGTLMLGDGTGNAGGLSSNSASVAVSANATLAVNRTGSVNQGAAGPLGNGSAVISGAGGFTQLGSGTTTLTLANTYTGTTTVSNGTLIINGAVASTSVVVNGSLGGSGVMANATLSGSGSINPGNSPGVMTAAATDPTGGLDYNFEFTEANALPNWGAPTASVNDVLRLTDATPFTAALGGTNLVTLYLNVGALTEGDVFTGGFYTDQNAAFLSSISSGTFQYFLADESGGTTYAGNTYSAYSGPLGFLLATVSQPAEFGAGEVSGYTTQFTVVPEPNVAALLGGLGALALLRRRR